jgi:microcompartment protein CcmK/EutM
MFLARIRGTVVAAAKHPTLAGCRMVVAGLVDSVQTIGRQA